MINKKFEYFTYPPCRTTSILFINQNRVKVVNKDLIVPFSIILFAPIEIGLNINKAKNLIIKITLSFTLACDYGYSA